MSLLIYFRGSSITFFKSLGSGNLEQVTNSTPNFFIIIFLFFIGVTSLAFYFLLRRFHHIHFLGRTIELGDDDNLFFTKITGKCGECSHPVKLAVRNNKSFIVCTKNYDHSIPFDWTKLGDVAKDHQQRTQST